MCFCVLFFFCKKKTAYDMRISDWSSDVCSSDLGSHDFESPDRGIGRGDRFETAHRLDQYLELSVIGLDHVIEILHLPVGRLPVQLSFAHQFGDRCTIARRFVGIVRGRLFPVLQRSEEHSSELQSLMRISYAVFCLKKKIINKT